MNTTTDFSRDADLSARLDRIESELAIRQLPARYALAVDSRDLDTVVGLFVADVNNGSNGIGRPALLSWFREILSSFHRSVHFTSGHVIDFTDADHATGSVYCRAEHEDGDKWVVMGFRYRDRYRREGGAWFFEQRRLQPWYVCDALERPNDGPFSRWPGREESIPMMLPEAFPTWEPFWANDAQTAGG